GQLIRISRGRDLGVGRGDNPRRRIVKAGQLVKRQIAGPVMLAVCAVHRHGAVTRGANGNKAHGLVANVAVNIGIDNVLRGRGKDRKRFAELIPVLRGVKIKQRHADGMRIIDDPSQRNLARFTVQQRRDDGPVPRDRYIKRNVRLALYVNHLVVDLWFLPAVGRLVFAGDVEVFDKQILHVRIEIGKSPGDALVVADSNKGHAREREAFYVEVAGMEL